MSAASSFRSYARSNSSSSENLPPRTLARVAREIRDLHKSPPEGVRLVVDTETGVPGSLGEVLAEIEGPTETPYENRFFQLKLVLSADFPASPPRGFFLTKIYHPNVDMSTGAICVNTLKKDWTVSTTFSHVLGVIRCLLIIPFPESSLNDEAGKLFMDSYEEYSKRARIMSNIHGRPSSSVIVDNEAVKSIGDIDPSVSESSSSLLSTSESCGSPAGRNGKTLVRNSSSMNSSSGSIRSTMGGGKTATEKRSKKKGLKRL